jgi:hypothetical protein
VARVPDGLLAVDGPAPDPHEGAVRARFWAASPADAASADAAPEPLGRRAVPDGSRRHTAGPSGGSAFADAGPAPTSGGAVPVGGIALRGGAILVLPGMPTAADRAAIAAAAGPLLDLLAQRGLLITEPLHDRRTP